MITCLGMFYLCLRHKIARWKGILNNAFVQSLEWNSVTESLSRDYIAFEATTEAYVNHCTNELEWWSPLALTAKVNASDNPRSHEAMNAQD